MNLSGKRAMNLFGRRDDYLTTAQRTLKIIGQAHDYILWMAQQRSRNARTQSLFEQAAIDSSKAVKAVHAAIDSHIEFLRGYYGEG